MTSHLWCWSDIVDPKLVKAAMEEERRGRQKRQPSNDPSDKDEEPRPVAA